MNPNRKLILLLVLSLVAVSAALAGCTTPTPTSAPSTTATPTPAPTLAPTPPPSLSGYVQAENTYNESNNGQTVNWTGGNLTITLAENPSTGYSWNWTLTPGLELVNTSYASGGAMPGAGGSRTWILKVAGNTSQTFSALYKRPWEPVFGNETTYALNISPVTATAAGKTFEDASNNQSVTLQKGETVAIRLKENPTTGFQWNVSATSGLNVTDKGYKQDPSSPGMTGVGGVHTWEITATGAGDQAFDGIYKRSWEPVSGDETTYHLRISVS